MLKSTNTEKLKEKMAKEGKSVKECAREIGLSRQAMYQKINGEREFKCAELGALCSFLHIDVSPEFSELFFS